MSCCGKMWNHGRKSRNQHHKKAIEITAGFRWLGQWAAYCFDVRCRITVLVLNVLFYDQSVSTVAIMCYFNEQQASFESGVTLSMKALKCRTLGAELAHACMHIALYYDCTVYAPFTLTTSYLVLLLVHVGNGRQLNLPRGNVNDWKWPPWLCESEKQAITRERKLFSKIYIL